MNQIIQIETEYKKVEIPESWAANQSAILQAWSSVWTRDYRKQIKLAVTAGLSS